MSLIDNILANWYDVPFVWIEGYDEAVRGISYDQNRIYYSITACVLVHVCQQEHPDYEESLAYVMQELVPMYTDETNPHSPQFIFDLQHG